jgi:hypothetical protein
LKNLRRAVRDFLADDGLSYDPAHVAFVFAGSAAFLGLLFWILWALLVFQGWTVNLAAFGILVGIIFALYRLYHVK